MRSLLFYDNYFPESCQINMCLNVVIHGYHRLSAGCHEVVSRLLVGFQGVVR